MTSAPQPNELGYAVHEALDARNVDPDAADEAEQQPKYVGDMPDDPEDAQHYRPDKEDA
jgi:hypothetical protein